MDYQAYRKAKVEADDQVMPAEFIVRKYTFGQRILLTLFSALLATVEAILRLGGFPLRRAISRGLGTLLHLVMRKKNRIARINLDLAFGDRKNDTEKRKIIRDMYCHFVRLGLDLVFTEVYFPVEKLTEIEIDHPEYIEEAKAYGCGMIGITGHLGNWELAGAVQIANGLRIAPIFKKLSNPIADKLLNDKRLAHGFDMLEMPERRKVEKEDGTVEYIKPSLAPAIKRLLFERNTGVFFMIDQYSMSPFRVDVPVFGIDAPTNVGAAKYALQFGAPCIMGAGIYFGDSFKIFVHKPFVLEPKGDETESYRYWMAHFTREWEKLIEQYPEQWSWGHKRFYRDNYK